MRHKTKLFALAMTAATAASLIAGGIALEIGKPSTNPEAQAKHAVLVVRGYACTAPEKTIVSASAEGLVNGKRETIPLKLIALSGQSMYAVTRQWPADGRWVIALTGMNPNFKFQPSAIVRVEGDSVDWSGVTRFSHAPAKEDIEAALNMEPARTAVASRE